MHPSGKASSDRHGSPQDGPHVKLSFDPLYMRACRTAVLRKLGHVSPAGVVTLKGRAASCISTGDALMWQSADRVPWLGNAYLAAHLCMLVSCRESCWH